jgi:hypothetical protein
VWYLKRYKDVANANICPLLHYEQNGKYEGRQSHSNNIQDNKKIISEMKASKNYAITKRKRSPRIILSMTSFPGRINEVPFALHSLMKQTMKPDEIILWLGIDKFPNKDRDLPDTLIHMKKRGLIIKYVTDIRSFTKLIPALNTYPEDIIVTADDDIYYPRDWLEKLYKSYLKYPKDIHCHRVHRIKIVNNHDFAPYNDWFWESKDVGASYLNFITGVGGVLYPPHVFYKDVLKSSKFKKLCPLADDIWFWAMAVLNKTKIRNIENGYSCLTFVNADRESGVLENQTLGNENVLNGKNDEQINNVLHFYPDLMKYLDKEIKGKNK